MSDSPEKTEDTGLSAEEFAALAERFSTVAPLLRGFLGEKETEKETKESGTASVFNSGGGGEPPPGRPRERRKNPPREALLLSLKPYLSPERREMADYLVRLCRMYEALRGFF